MEEPLKIHGIGNSKIQYSKILNMMGVKTKLTKDSIKIYGQPNLKIIKPIIMNFKKYIFDNIEN